MRVLLEADCDGERKDLAGDGDADLHRVIGAFERISIFAPISALSSLTLIARTRTINAPPNRKGQFLCATTLI